MLKLELPYPPSINHYFRVFRNRTVISIQGRAFRHSVCSALVDERVPKFAGSVAIRIKAYPPDRRKRDIDNIQKPLLDALEKGGLFFDDSQVKHLTTVMCEPVEAGKVIVTIRQIKFHEN